MGLFSKKKKKDETGEHAAPAPDPAQWQQQAPQGPPPAQWPQQQAAPQAPPGTAQSWQDVNQVGQQMAQQWQQGQAAGYAANDPAMFGGPSNQPVAADDPIWAPINGVSIDHYVAVARECRTRGVTDEAGMAALAQGMYGFTPEQWGGAVAGWVDRMRVSQAVGQRFNQLYQS